MASFKKNGFSPLHQSETNDTYPDFDPYCVVVGFHATGRWCSACQRLGMPWGDNLPVVVNDSQDEEDRVAPRNSLLEGVDVHNPQEINIVALVADFGLRDAIRPEILEQAASLPNFGTLERAGRRVELLTRRLDGTRGATWRDLGMGEVLQMALIDPSHSANQLFDFIRTLRHLLLPGAEFPDSPTNSERLPRSLTNRDRTDEVDDDIDFDLEYSMNPNYDRFEPFKHKNKPTKEGEWKFLEGQDLSKAKLGKPQPGKFFITREKVGGKVEEKDIRYFVRWKYFDWDDTLHIERLNKWIQQLSYRTLGTENSCGSRWTAREKDELIHQIAHHLQALQPATRNQLWPPVFQGMVNVFGKLMQKRGGPLATSTKLKINGDIVPCTAKPGELDDDRFGWDRELKTMVNKTDDFGEVKKLLQEYFNDTKKRKAGTIEDDGDQEEDADGETNASKKSKLKAKPKIILVLKPGQDAPNGRPGPPPPPPGTGGADFSGAIDNSALVISAR